MLESCKRSAVIEQQLDAIAAAATVFLEQHRTAPLKMPHLLRKAQRAIGVGNEQHLRRQPAAVQPRNHRLQHDGPAQ